MVISSHQAAIDRAVDGTLSYKGRWHEHAAAHLLMPIPPHQPNPARRAPITIPWILMKMCKGMWMCSRVLARQEDQQSAAAFASSASPKRKPFNNILGLAWRRLQSVAP